MHFDTGNKSSVSDWKIGGTSESGGNSSKDAFVIFDINASAYRLVVQNSTGNVGIGVNEPAYKLAVGGTLNATGNATFTGDVTTEITSLSAAATMNLNNKGSASSNTGTQITGVINFGQHHNGASLANAKIEAERWQINAGAGSASRLIFSTKYSGGNWEQTIMDFGGNWTFGGTISNTGLISTKQAALYQGVKATGHDSSHYGYFGMGESGYTTLLAAGDRGMDLRFDSQCRFFTQQNSTPVLRMVVRADGKVGIGPDSSPDYLLDVQGTLGVDGVATFADKVGIDSGGYTQKQLHIGDEGQMLLSHGTDTVGEYAGIFMRAEGGEENGMLRTKGLIAFERTAAWGVGDMKFCILGDANNSAVTNSDVVLKLDSSKNATFSQNVTVNGDTIVKAIRTNGESAYTSASSGFSANDWVTIGYVGGSAGNRAKFMFYWDGLTVGGCCHHGYAILECGNMYNGSYNYGYDQYIRLLAQTHHNSFGITGARLRRGGTDLYLQVQISGAPSGGGFYSYILEKWNTCAKVTPAVDAYSGTVTQTIAFSQYAEYADASGYVNYNGDRYFNGTISYDAASEYTAYPLTLDIARDAVLSHSRLPDGEYNVDDKKHQLDHSKLHDYLKIAGEYDLVPVTEDTKTLADQGIYETPEQEKVVTRWGRDSGATVSCLVEVVKDLMTKVEVLEAQVSGSS
jgi:hypothetical protein